MTVHALDPKESTTRVSVYRTLPCQRCAELERRIAELENIRSGQKLWPFQAGARDAQCRFCAAPLFAPNYYGMLEKKHRSDERFCPGPSWWRRRSCPDRPHMHRACGACGARWLELPHAETPYPKETP